MGPINAKPSTIIYDPPAIGSVSWFDLRALVDAAARTDLLAKECDGVLRALQRPRPARVFDRSAIRLVSSVRCQLEVTATSASHESVARGLTAELLALRSLVVDLGLLPRKVRIAWEIDRHRLSGHREFCGWTPAYSLELLASGLVVYSCFSPPLLSWRQQPSTRWWRGDIVLAVRTFDRPVVA